MSNTRAVYSPGEGGTRLTDGAGNQLPYLDGVVFRPVPEGATRAGRYEPVVGECHRH